MIDAEVLVVSVHVEAEPSTVFPFFTDPGRYVQWMGSDATIEAVPGGVYRVRMRDGVEVGGHFIEVDEPKRIVFTWGWSMDDEVAPGSTRVEVTLTPSGSGTDVELKHFGLPSAAQRDHHKQGWDLYLSRLAMRATGADPGPDPNAKAR